MNLQREPDKGNSYRLLPLLCSDLFIKPYLKTSNPINWDGGDVSRKRESDTGERDGVGKGGVNILIIFFT